VFVSMVVVGEGVVGGGGAGGKGWGQGCFVCLDFVCFEISDEVLDLEVDVYGYRGLKIN
jgi:hypothetical protein